MIDIRVLCIGLLVPRVMWIGEYLVFRILQIKLNPGTRFLTSCRYSCAFFNDGALDMIIEALPSCMKEGEKPKYEPLRVEEHIKERYKQSYGAGGTVIGTA